MSDGGRKEREERAVDALIVLVLRQFDGDDDDIDPKYLPELTDEEKSAMVSIGPGFVGRLLIGERPLKCT